MSENTETVVKPGKPFKKRGNNKMAPQCLYVTRDTRAMKKSVELFKTIKRKAKITAAEKSALAYFLNPWETTTDQ